MRSLMLFAIFSLYMSEMAFAQLKPASPLSPVRGSWMNPKQGAAHSAHSTEGKIRCSTMQIDSVLRANNPDMGSLDEFEKWIQQEMSNYLNHQAGLKTPPPIYTIPVVYHIIHNGEAVGSGTNLSANQVNSQTTVLNNDYRRVSGTPGYNTHPDGADSEIQFCMAAINPSGQTMAEPGINRINRSTAGFSAPPYSQTYIDNTIKPATQWDPTKYLNIWVCNLGNGLLGYAQFPSSSGLSGLNTNGGAANTDGVVILYSSIGTTPYNTFSGPYNRGRTASHEVGHWLGLRHIWGDGGCSVDDYCTDTPASDAANYGCPTGTTSCSSVDMIENYMDYTDDNCMNIFTNCQKTRMRTVLQVSPRRLSLTTSTVCNTNTPPTCGFTPSSTTVTEGGTVNFTDASSGATSWSWTFQGGSPATSTGQNPTGITYATAGSYNVTLIASNAYGTCTLTQVINVVQNVGCDTLNYQPPGTLTVYSGGNGYVCGWNTSYEDLSKAEYFASYSPYTHVTGGLIGVGVATSGSGNASVTVAIWDNTGTGGAPGTIIGQTSLSLAAIDAAIPAGGGLIEVLFPAPVAVTGPFYMGIRMNNFAASDSLGLISNTDGNSSPNTAWEEWGSGAGGGWYAFNDANSWGLSISQFISPYMTNLPVSALATATPTAVCIGDNITFDASASTNDVSYAWTFTGGTPASATTASQVVSYSAAGTYTGLVTVGGTCQGVDTASVSIVVRGEPNITTTTTQLSCSSGSLGSATASASGGGGSPYTYTWSDGQTAQTATGLVAGTYNVTVTGANTCTASASAVIAQPSTVSISATGTDASCGGADGSAISAPSGGTSPYTYSWSDGQTSAQATGLAAGTYTVTVTDANTCTANATVTISTTGGGAMTTNIVANNVLCNGNATGNALVSVSGGTSPYSYLWSSNANGQTSQLATGLAAGTYTVTITEQGGCTNVSTVTVTQPSAITLASSTTSAGCGGSGGTATVIPSGGVSPYTYLWDNGQTGATAGNLSAATYNVTVTDQNNCAKSVAISVTATAGPILSSIATDVSCNGANDGTATANATGGSSPYTYNWTGGGSGVSLSGLGGGVYTVTVTDGGGCSATSSVTITEPSALTASATSANVSCNGASNGSGNVVAGGGTVPYSYLWNNGETISSITGLAAGTYTVTVSDGQNCSETASVTVTQPSSITITIVTSTNATCGNADGAATVSASGGSGGFTYQWNNTQTSTTATGLAAGTYIVTATDANGCNNNLQIAISNTGAASITSNSIDASCQGNCDGVGSAVVSSGISPYTYAWSDPSSQTTATATGLCAGNLSVTVTDANGCKSTATLSITAPSVTVNGTPTNPSASGACNGSVSTSPSGGISPYTFLWNDPGNSSTAAATGLCAGSYCVTIADANGCTSTECFTINDPICNMTLSATSTIANCGGKTGTATVVVTGGNGPYTYLWNDGSNQTTAIAGGLSAGTFSVTVTDLNNCQQTTSVVVNSTPALTGNTQSSFASCGNADGTATINITAGTSPYTYQWSAAAGSQTTATATGLLAGGPYNISVSDASGCTMSESVTVGAVGGPNVNTTSTTDDQCGQGTGTATVTPMNGTTPYTYIWNDSNGQTTQTATGLTAGTYLVTITDSIGCTYVASMSVGSTSGLNISLSSTASSCGLANGSASASVSGGTLPYTYSWNTTPPQSTSNVNGLAVGTYLVTVTDVNGCNSTQAVTVSGTAGITGTVNTTSATCGVSNGSVIVGVNGGTPPYVYAWNSPVTQTTATITGLGAGTYTVTVIDNQSCTGVFTASITTSSGFTVNTNTVSTTCSSNNGTATALPSGGNSPFVFQWGSSTGNQSTQTATGLGAGTYPVTVTDNTGCTVFSSAVLTAGNPGPVLAPSATDASCGSSNGSATVSVSSGTSPFSYLWSTGATSITTPNLPAGNYTVTVSDSNGCSATVGVTVNEASTLSVNANSSTANCGASDGLVSLNVTGGTSPYSYIWDDPVQQTTSLATGLSAGTYVCTITDYNGCSTTSTTTISTTSGLAITGTTVTDEYCGGNNGTATVLVTGTQTPYAYHWSDAGAQTTAVATGLAAGSYSVTITDASGCAVVSDVLVQNSFGDLSIQTSAVTESCGQNNGSATALVLSGGAPPFAYLWDDSQGQTAATATGLDAGTYLVTVTGSDGCSRVYPAIVGSTGQIVTGEITHETCKAVADGAIAIEISGGVEPYQILWSNGASTDSISDLPSTAYYVSVTDANSCTTVDTFIVETGTDFCINIPSGFTPNEDGTNDTWRLRGIEGYPEASVEIYNRWGSLLFSSKGYTDAWDGTFNGEDLPAAAYYYIIALDSDKKYTGTVTIIR